MDFEQQVLHSIAQSMKWMEKSDDRLLKIEKCLVKQEENLKEHMRRTEAAEKAVDRIVQTLKPVQTHVAHVEGVLKFIGLLSVISTVAMAIYQIFFLH